MARGRKKLEIRDFRFEKIRAAEAMKFLNLDSMNKGDERFFYRLVEEGYINRHNDGGYYLGEVIRGYIVACGDKRYTLRYFLSGLIGEQPQLDFSRLKSVSL